MNHSNQLFHYIIKMNKEDSAFFYFQLEANDGICFYSTIPYPQHAQYREIELRGDIKLKAEMEQILNECQKKFPIEIVLNEIISDNKNQQ